MRIFGWKINGEFPDVDKSIVVVAPHTSYWDAIIGKLFLKSSHVKHKLLVKKDFFYFPLNIVLRLFGAVPVRGVKGHNAILDVCDMLEQSRSLHIVICPEGRFLRTERWNDGFYYMALRAHVPIVVGYLDYQKKEAGVKGVITDLSDINKVYGDLSEYYSGVSARHPQNFALPKNHQRNI